MTAPTSPTLLEILDLEQLEEGMFRGHSTPGSHLRSFGGSVAAQALVAAGRTVGVERLTHSLHAYFLRPGDASKPIVYFVDPIRDGGSFTTRRVVAQQNGQAIFHLSASFQRPEKGLEHQVPQLDAPGPEELPSLDDQVALADPATQEWFAGFRQRFSVELRVDGMLPRVAHAGNAPPRQRIWMRVADELPDSQLIHQCAVTYVSDLFLLGAALPPHAISLGSANLQGASLDHAVWFHDSLRADQWLFYDTEGTWAGGGRGLCRGHFFNTSGVLLATVMQEGLIRVREPR